MNVAIEPQTLVHGVEGRVSVVRHPDGQRFVFGLDWMPVIGGNPQKLARRRARSLRSTHYLMAGDPVSVVGCGLISRHLVSEKTSLWTRREPLYSAAALFARAHSSGVVAGIIQMMPKGYWLVAVKGGLVLAQTDRWYTELSEANAALASIKQRFPSIQVLGLVEISTHAWPDWLSGVPDSSSALKKLTELRTMTLGASFLLASTVMLWPWNTDSSVQVGLHTEQLERAQWQEVIEQFIRTHPVHRAEHLTKVLGEWNRTPLSPGGWKLRKILCESVSINWHCAAQYQRIKRLARSSEIETSKPEHWQAEYLDLDHAVLRWQVAGAASPFDFQTPSIPLKEWMSYLQDVRPMFESIQIGSGHRVVLSAPLNADGIALKPPVNLKPLTKRSVAMRGPLRSLPALMGIPAPVRWKTLMLEIGPALGTGISKSELMVQLTGELFEVSQ